MGHGMNRFMPWPGHCPLASPAAPVALRQSRILRTMRERHQQAAQCQSLRSYFKEIRFCSVSLSAFEPSLSGFAPAPTEMDFSGADNQGDGKCPDPLPVIG
jgi:hypothetical protein